MARDPREHMTTTEAELKAIAKKNAKKAAEKYEKKVAEKAHQKKKSEKEKFRTEAEKFRDKAEMKKQAKDPGYAKPSEPGKLPTKAEIEAAKLKKKEYMSPKVKVPRMVERDAEERRQGFESGIKQAEKFFPHEGMDPRVRQAMQFQANKEAQRERQAAERRLLGEQSQRGILGKSGVAYAQRRDLATKENEARAQARQHLDVMNAEQAMKNTAARFAAGQGEAAQRGLSRQQALADIAAKKEHKREKKYLKDFTKAFKRV